MHAWVVHEQVFENFHGPERIEIAEVTIPAWTAKTNLHSLVPARGTGFAEIAKSVLGHLPPDPRGDRASAVQTARARFDTHGFSAAAVTVLSVMGKAMSLPLPPCRAIIRAVEVGFDRPFAVVVATSANGLRRPVPDLLRGLPAFGAWVSEPMEPSKPNETM